MEGGLTRLAAVFQSQYPAVVGPVRSGRLTDEGIADDLNHPVFAYSGTNAIFLPDPAVPARDRRGRRNHPELFYRSVSTSSRTTFTPMSPPWRPPPPPTPLPPPCSTSSPAGGQFTGAGVGPGRPHRPGLPGGGRDMGLERRRPAVAARPGRPGRCRPLRRPAERHQRDRPVRPVHHLRRGDGRGRAPAPIPEGLLVGSGAAWYFSNGEGGEGDVGTEPLTSVTVWKAAAGASGAADPGPHLGGAGSGGGAALPAAVNPARRPEAAETTGPARVPPVHWCLWLLPRPDPPCPVAAPVLTWSNGVWPRCCAAG